MGVEEDGENLLIMFLGGQMAGQRGCHLRWHSCLRGGTEEWERRRVGVKGSSAEED